MDNKQIGIRIKNRRIELGLTLQDVANIVGVASSTIQRYESGHISQYKLPVLESIAKAINVNPTWLVKKDAPMEIDTSDKTIDSLCPEKSNGLSNEEMILLKNFNKLNATGKKEASKRVSELTCIPMYSDSELTATTDKSEKILESMYDTIAAHDDDLTPDEKEEMNRRILDKLNKLHKDK
ncbi:helix-turn-helix domain-containing protein [Clostridium neuense]|uniref:Helix-turn-helix domain-containing protein n=1 Tax=Clostridium neuense TaxID=1728934 RepID=A0ABW8TG87_9CLOT